MARRLWIIVAWIILMMCPVNAGPRLLESIDAPPLPAWEEFCGQYPMECSVDVSQPVVITLTRELRVLLLLVNLVVNGSLRPMTDNDHWGVVDLWSYSNDGLGDCEDYQLLKRKLLISAGLPRRALLMTVVVNEMGEGHAVLTVRTNRGDFILDNRTNDILEWFKTNYTFIKRESSFKPGWAFLKPELAGTRLASAVK